ncbi:hypothetical protein BSKO_06494 [Bryopsis sp. KO-2023]|nr:hypothetical protein BSKO_06494 [Bryopsis sp. KO-2023]
MTSRIFNFTKAAPCFNQTSSRRGGVAKIHAHDMNQSLRLAVRNRSVWGGRRDAGFLPSRHVECHASNPGEFPLTKTAMEIEKLFLEVCVENSGRPAAAALTDFVGQAMEAFLAGYSLKKLLLEMEFGAGQEEIGFRLTASERSYRQQWLDTVYVAMQMLIAVDDGEGGFHQVEPLRPWKEEDERLMTLVQRTLKGQMTGEEQALVKFDRALATRGASGGVASEERTISPQFVPVSQLVLLTSKVYKERMAR